MRLNFLLTGKDRDQTKDSVVEVGRSRPPCGFLFSQLLFSVISTKLSSNVFGHDNITIVSCHRVLVWFLSSYTNWNLI